MKKKGKSLIKQNNHVIVFFIVSIISLLLIIGFFFKQQQQYQQHAQAVPTDYPATDGQILWEAGWETGNDSQWSIHAGGEWGNSNVEVVTSPVRYGKYAGKLTLNPGSGNVRAEISAGQEDTGGLPGQEWYYSFSVYFPSNPNQSGGWSDWNDFTQWMDMRANCSPPIGFYINPDGTLSMSNEITTQEGDCGYGDIPVQNYPLGPLEYDKWIDFTARFKWSENSSEGFAQVWRDGKEVLPLTHMRTLDPGSSGVYMEQAMYRPNPTNQSVVYIDGTRRHTAFAAGDTTLPTTNITQTPVVSSPITPTSFCIGGCCGTDCLSITPTISSITSPAPTDSEEEHHEDKPTATPTAPSGGAPIASVQRLLEIIFKFLEDLFTIIFRSFPDREYHDR